VAASVDAVRAESLTVAYRHGRGIEELDLEVPAGEVFGFLGPNGAGKTTTIRTLLDLLRPTSGRVAVLGLDSHTDSMEVRARTGYLPGDLALPDRLTGAEVLDWCASMRPGTPPVRRDELVERFDVQLDRPVRRLSRGNRQKLGLVQAFQHDPELVILDEPTSGLDPLVQDEFQGLLRDQVAAGRSVFLSSHSLDEVQHVADRVGIVREGRLVTIETVESLRERGLRRVTATMATGQGGQAVHRLTPLPGVTDLHADDDIITFAVGGSFAAVVEALAGLEVVDLLSRSADLDEIFLAMYRGESAEEAVDELEADER
jgi:ABC-2 type transport system ATP-binding protein